MPDVFISYSTQDQKFADFVHEHLVAHNIQVFMASLSIKPGQQWGDEIFYNLKSARWVFFLASKAACDSPWVQQELGVALGGAKNIIPIVWNMEPGALPGWISKIQALDLRDGNVEELKARCGAIAKQLKADKIIGGLVLGALISGYIFCSLQEDEEARLL